MTNVRFADTEIELTADFRCEHCGHRAHVLVTGDGRGYASALERPELAAKRARKEALDHARDTLVFITCPACGLPSDEANAVRRRRLGAYAVAALVVTAIAIVGGLLAGAPPEVVGVLVAIAVPLPLLFTYATSSEPWKRIDERVRFVTWSKKQARPSGEPLA